jgi:hypothetical protein
MIEPMAKFFMQTYPDFPFEVPSNVFKVKPERNAKTWCMEVNLLSDDIAGAMKTVKDGLQTNHKWHPDEKVGPDFNIVIMDPPKVRKTELMIPVH